MKRFVLILVLLLFPLTASAGEKANGTNFFVVKSESWETSETTGYWMWHGNGVRNAASGPLIGIEPIECHGAGFWDANGSWGEGVCVSGSGEDTRKYHWGRGKGEDVGRWEILSATGKYAGVTGHGTYKSTDLSDGHSISEWEGEYTVAE
jgi:hypothetical protein